MLPNNAVLHITSCCSHHCPFCYYIDDTATHYPQDYGVLKRIVNELAKYDCENILFVGGDPASHPDVINLGHYAKSLGMNTSILSNTLKLNSKFTWTDIANAFNTIEVTIHSSEPKVHNVFCGKERAFEAAVKNLKTIDSLSQESIHLGVVFNITPDTYYDIYNAIKRIVTIDNIHIDHVVFQRIVSIGRAFENKNWMLKQQHISIIFAQIEQIEKEFSLDIYLEDSFPLCTVPERYRHFVHSCQWGSFGISLDMHGNVAKCCVDSRYTLGNILETPLPEIWNLSRKLEERRRGLLVPERCRHCILYPKCGGGCILASELNNCSGDPLITMEVI